jgi:hypothetical protein
MAEEKVEVNLGDLEWFRSAAGDFARGEIARIVQVVVEELRSCPAEDVFGDVGARHLWDEYCWALQEGPFDIEIVLANTNLGSLSAGFDAILRTHVLAQVENLPKYAQVFLSEFAFQEDIDSDNEKLLGGISIDEIVNTVTEAVNERACRRNLSLIGPHREDAIGYQIEGTGFVWSVLPNRKQAHNLIGAHVDAMINPNGDLSELAEEMVEAFIIAAREDEGGALFLKLLEHFDTAFRSMIREKDVLPSLQKTRVELLKAWDG